MDYGLTAIAAGTAWARVEGNIHYPSDVLFGAALGNFMAVFFTEAFLGLEQRGPIQLQSEYAPGVLRLNVVLRF